MYGKIFSSMFQGSLHGQWEAIVTFTVMIVLADQNGEVDMTAEALSAQTSIPIDIIKRGISDLESPDKKSRSPDEEGRRIVRVSDDRDWGWQITNYAHYREIRSADERREYMRQYQRNRRSKPLTSVNTGKHPSTLVNNVNQSSKQYAVSSKQEALNNHDSARLSSFATVAHSEAYERVKKRASNPESFDAMLGTLAEPITGGTAYSWLVIGQALLELDSAGGGCSPNIIRAFCHKLANPTLTTLGRKGGATGDGIDWTVKIDEADPFHRKRD